MYGNWRCETCFEPSVDKRKLRYVEHLEDVDTKSYANVKDTYQGTEKN